MIYFNILGQKLDISSLKRWLYSHERTEDRQSVVDLLAQNHLNFPLLLRTSNVLDTDADLTISQETIHHHFYFYSPAIHIEALNKQDFICRDLDELRSQLRESIVAFRKQQLQHLSNKFPQIIDLAYQQEASALATSLFTHSSKVFLDAITNLTQIFQARYQHHLNSYRIQLSSIWIDLWKKSNFSDDQKLNNLCAETLSELIGGTDYLLMAEVLQQHSQKLQSWMFEHDQKRELRADWPGLVIDAEAWIQKNFRRGISLKEVSSHLNISSPYLAKIYKKTTEYTVVEYINVLRLNWAYHENQTGQRSITQIALDAGFNCPEHFQRLYKKKYGLSPLKDRKSRPSKT